MKEDKIKKLFLNALGNSISNGYSFRNSSLPLLERTEFLRKFFENFDIDLETNQFARSQSNCDELTFNYFIKDISIKEIHKLNRADAKQPDTPIKNLTDDFLDLHYPLNRDLKISNVFFNSNSSISNICIYCGGTGSFLDKFTRSYDRNNPLDIAKGVAIHSPNIFKYFNNDIKHMQGILDIIQGKNRLGSNTQVYLGGLPNLLGSNITFYPNSKISKLSKEYANSSFVNGVKSKLFYSGITNTDFHYDEEEYVQFLIYTFQSILDNYYYNKALISIDRSLYNLNNSVLLEENNLGTNVTGIIDEQLEYLSNHSCDLKIFKLKLIKYINTNYQSLFHLLNCKEAIKKYTK